MASGTKDSSGAIQIAVDLEVFVRKGCPHCADAKKILSALSVERSEVRISIRDVSQDALSLDRLRKLSDARGLNTLNVLSFSINGQLIVGFSEEANMGNRILAELAHVRQTKQAIVTASESCAAEETLTCTAENQAPSKSESFKVSMFDSLVIVAG